MRFCAHAALYNFSPPTRAWRTGGASIRPGWSCGGWEQKKPRPMLGRGIKPRGTTQIRQELPSLCQPVTGPRRQGLPTATGFSPAAPKGTSPRQPRARACSRRPRLSERTVWGYFLSSQRFLPIYPAAPQKPSRKLLFVSYHKAQKLATLLF